MLKDIFGFAEHHQKGTYGPDYKLKLTRNSDNAVLNKDNATNNAKIKISSIDWYVPSSNPSIKQQGILVKQIVPKTLTKLHNVARSVFMKEINTQNFWTFALGTEEEINVPTWIIVGFQQNDRQHDQNSNNESFCRLPVTSAQYIIGTEKYPDSCIL